jgi:hypothetical protein
MKSASAKPETAAPADKGGAVPEDAAGVAGELRAIDTAPLERLLEIRKEEARLEDYRRRADEMKGKVKEPVWRRVMDDYSARVAALEDQAAPLRDQVRTEYQKLRALLDRVNVLRESTDLEKAEFEFRHAVGELTDRQLEERLRGPAKTLEQCTADLGAIEEQRSRFLSAFESEAQLDAPAPASTAEAVTPIVTPAPAIVEVIPAVQVVAEDTPSPTLIAASTTPPDVQPDVTGAVPAERLAAMAEAGEDPARAAADQADSDTDERTFMLPLAGLVITDGSPQSREYRLATMNYIGRSDESQIVIAKPGVSRKHALIIASADGFTIRDLGSQNGTFVNGKRIADHQLKNGDQIAIADTKLTFRSPWPHGAKG